MKHQKKKDLLFLATKLVETIPDASNVKEYYKSYLKKKTLAKLSKTFTHQLKTIDNPNVGKVKSAIIEHPKTSHKFSKAIRQTKKFSQVGGAAKKFDSTLYIKTKRVKIFLTKKI